MYIVPIGGVQSSSPVDMSQTRIVQTFWSNVDGTQVPIGRFISYVSEKHGSEAKE